MWIFLRLITYFLQLLLQCGMPELVDAAFNFLFQQSSECATSVGPSTPDGVDSIIVKTIEDLIALSCEQPMPKVGSNKTELWQFTFFLVLEYRCFCCRSASIGCGFG